MSINSTDDKFGLPKPDFEALPKKKVIPPLLAITAVILMLVAIKMGYDFYFKIVDHKKPTSSEETVNHTPTDDQHPDANDGPPYPSKATPAREVGIDPNAVTHESVRDSQIFEHKKNNKIKKSISATQKQLAAKQTKPLVKPGTYQELKEPQGIYHLVVVSHLEKRSAMKVVQQLMKKKLGVCLILPRTDKGEKYYRVTIGHSKTRYEADDKLEQFKPTYNHLFILKY